MTIQEIHDTIKSTVPELNIEIKGVETIWIETAKGRYTLFFHEQMKKFNLFCVSKKKMSYYKTIAEVLAALPN